jgi:TDG/mug DNA glycosylase family protein
LNTEAPRKSAFAPFAFPDTRLLVLGTLPGEASLAARRYYAHPQNQFWRLIGAVIGREDLASFDYETRVAALREARIGLWDTIASAIRTGSLDAAIREVEHAPLAGLVATLPALQAVAFNGATSARIGRKLLAGTKLALVDLPSSSPAYAAMPFAAKRERWLHLQRFLD